MQVANPGELGLPATCFTIISICWAFKVHKCSPTDTPCDRFPYYSPSPSLISPIALHNILDLCLFDCSIYVFGFIPLEISFPQHAWLCAYILGSKDKPVTDQVCPNCGYRPSPSSLLQIDLKIQLQSPSSHIGL